MSEIASKLAKAITEGHRKGLEHAATTGPENRKEELHDHMEFFEREIAAVWKEKGLLDFNGPMFSDELRRAFGSISEPTHQVDIFWSLLAVFGLALSGGSAAADGYASQIRNHAMHSQGDVQPDIGAAVQAFRQGIRSEGDAKEIAQYNGYRSAAFDVLYDLTENFPPIEALLTLWRRNEVPESYVDLVLRRMGYSPASIELLKSLRYAPMSPASAIAAATQNQITKEQLASLLAENGIDPTWTEVLYQTEGATMPPDMANRLFREGRIDQAKYEEILTESNLKNKYVPLMALLRYRVPPMRTIISAYRKKLILRDYAAEALGKLGFDEVVQQWMLDEAETSGTAGTHHLSLQQDIALYEAELRTREETVAAIVAIGWAPDIADLEIQLADHRKSVARQSRSANAIGSRYVSWKIDRHAASVALDALQLPTTARDEALAAWDIEREERRPRLTEAQLHRAYKAHNMSAADAQVELLAMGYTDRHAAIILATDFAPVTAQPKTRDVTAAEERQRYRYGIVTRAQLLALLVQLGYDAAEAEEIAVLEDAKIAAGKI